MGKDAGTSEDSEAEGYLWYSVEEADGPLISAAFKRQAEHLHLEVPPGLGVAKVGLTQRRRRASTLHR